MASSVIFIGSPDHSVKKDLSQAQTYLKLFLVSPQDILFRIWASFVPPLTQKYKRIYVDFTGPILGFVMLAGLLVYGYSFKKYKIGVSPTEVMLAFATIMPIICYILGKLGKSSINFYETLSLVGYSLYGHLLTLLVSFVLFHETSNVFFFVSLAIFGGMSSFRLILVFLKTMPVPGARLLVCSSISLINILFLIYLHFGFMHRNFY